MGGRAFVLGILPLYSDAGVALVTQQPPGAYGTLAFPMSHGFGLLDQIGSRALCNAIHGILVTGRFLFRKTLATNEAYVPS